MQKRTLVIAVTILSSMLFAQSSIQAPLVRGDKGKTPKRMREGQPIFNTIGRFSRGDRYTFKTEDMSFRVLENLNLERVANVVENDPQAQWLISGTITEFRSANYLLITKAVLKDKRRK